MKHRIETYFLNKLREQFSQMPINEALDFSDRKEIQKMIRSDMNSKRFRQELDRVFRQDFEDALRSAFGINSRGKLSNYVVDQIAADMKNGASREIIADTCKEVIAKLYRELALRYPFIIKGLKV